MNSSQLSVKLNDFLVTGLSDGLFLNIEHHPVKDFGEKKIIAPNTKQMMVSDGGTTALEFLKLLDANSYSAVLFDGAIISIQCIFSDNKLASHRYLYLPCPITRSVLQERPDEFSLADWIREIQDDQLRTAITSLGAFRFDYRDDMNSQAEEPHPISHMTFAAACCRIPLKAPLSISGFISFLIDNFYPVYAKEWKKYKPFLKCGKLPETITSTERQKHHLNWG